MWLCGYLPTPLSLLGHIHFGEIMKHFKSKFKWLNKLICRLFGCALTHVSAMAFEEGELEPVEILMVCPRCEQAHCHDWPFHGPSIAMDMDGNEIDLEFIPDFDIDRKTLN